MASPEEMQRMMGILQQSKGGDCCSGGSCAPKSDDEDGPGTSTRTKVMIGLFFLLLTSGGIFTVVMQMYDALQGRYSVLDHTDLPVLKDTFHGGEAHMVFCHYPSNGNNKRYKELYKGLATHLQSAGASVYGVNCEAKIKDDKTVLTHLKLADNTLGFTVANGANAKPVPLNYFSEKEQEGVVKYFKQATEPKAVPMSKPADFEQLCMSRKVCVVAAARGHLPKNVTEEVIIPALRTHRRVRTVALNKDKHQLKLSEEILNTRPSMEQAKSNGVDLICLSTVSNDLGPDATFGSFYQGDVKDSAAVDAFYLECKNAPVSLAASTAGALVRASTRPSMVNRPPRTTTTTTTTRRATTTTSTSTTTLSAQEKAERKRTSTTTPPTAQQAAEDDWADFIDNVNDEL